MTFNDNDNQKYDDNDNDDGRTEENKHFDWEVSSFFLKPMILLGRCCKFASLQEHSDHEKYGVLKGRYSNMFYGSCNMFYGQ